MCDCDRGCREGALGDGLAEDGEGRGEGFVLMFEGWDQLSWGGGGQGLCSYDEIAILCGL